MSAAHEAFQAHLDKLLQARPEHAIARLFVPAQRRDAFSAFECLMFELEQTLWHTREPQVALAKLQWWGEELQRSFEGAPRHPITRHLPPVRDAKAATAVAADGMSAAMDFLDAGSVGDLPAQQTVLAGFYAPLAQIESHCSGHGAGGGALRALSFLLRELGRLSCGEAVHPLVIPLNLLARHQLSRDALMQEGVAREGFLRDQLQALAALLTCDASADAGFAVRLRRRLDRRLAGHAAAAGKPSLAMRQAVGVPATTAWHAWREARRGI